MSHRQEPNVAAAAALAEFEKNIRQYDLHSSFHFGLVMKKLQQQAAKMPNRQLNNFFLQLNLATTLIRSFSEYSLAPIATDMILNENVQQVVQQLERAHRANVETHKIFVTHLLENIPKHKKTIDETSARLNTLKQYKANPTSFVALSAVIEDLKKLEKKKRYARIKNMVASVAGIVGIGMMIVGAFIVGQGYSTLPLLSGVSAPILFSIGLGLLGGGTLLAGFSRTLVKQVDLSREKQVTQSMSLFAKHKIVSPTETKAEEPTLRRAPSNKR